MATFSRKTSRIRRSSEALDNGSQNTGLYTVERHPQDIASDSALHSLFLNVIHLSHYRVSGCLLRCHIHSVCTIAATASAHFPSTAVVSSSLPNNPRFRIAPAFGASSRGCAASAFLYAVCNARTLVACLWKHS
jgi:hypothetical protein